MPSHHQEDHSPYTVQQLFDMVADIDRYSEFLPWCAASRVTSRNENVLKADLVIRFQAFRSKYSSKVTLNPADANGRASIITELVDGPFSHLASYWIFEPAKDGEGTIITFDLDFRFQSSILERMIGGMFAKATQKMIGAFKARAETLYGTE